MTLAERKAKALKELQEIEEEEKKLENERRQQLGDFYLSNIDALLALVPEHNKTSCRSNFNNADNCRCKRCFLEQAKNYWSWDSDYEVEIEIRNTRNSRNS